MTANSEMEGCDVAIKALASQNYPSSANLKPLVVAQALSLKSLVAKIDPDNRHPEHTFGLTTGTELL